MKERKEKEEQQNHYFIDKNLRNEINMIIIIIIKIMKVITEERTNDRMNE